MLRRLLSAVCSRDYASQITVLGSETRSRAEVAGLPARVLARLQREVTTWRVSLRGLAVPESIRQVWRAELPTPPVRWRVGQKSMGPLIPAFAQLDLRLAHPHGQ